MSRGSRRTLLAAVALLALVGAARAAVKPEDVVDREVTIDDLKPMNDYRNRHEYWYQVPKNPRGTIVFVHGCVHSGYNYFPQSKECNACRGLPEQLSHTLQALRRGYAVIAISSVDRDTGCWSWNEDGWDVAELLKGFLRDWGLDKLPFYGAGISSGASFLLKLPRYIKMDGIMSEALGIDEDAWGLWEVSKYPPTIYVSMVRDTPTAKKIEANRKELTRQRTPVEVIQVEERKVYPTYFSDRFPSKITPELSKEIAQGLFEIKMINKNGIVQEDPREASWPWMIELQALVPGLEGQTNYPEKPQDVMARGVFSLMNLAYAKHEIISDYITAGLMWFETGGSGDLKKYLDAYTYGWPSEDKFLYTANGTEITKERITLHTRPGTLPGCAIEHIVQEGDYCYVIADTFGIDLETLQGINPQLNCELIQPNDTVCLQAGDPNLKDLETAEEVPYNGTEAAAPAAAPRPAPTQTGAGAGAGTAAAPTGAPGIALVGANVTAPPNGTLPTTTKAGPTTTPRPENKPKAAPVAKPAPSSSTTTATATTDGSATTASSDSGSSGSNTGAIVGSVIGGLAAAALVAVGVWYAVKKRRTGARSMAVSNPTFEQGKLDALGSGAVRLSALAPRDLELTEVVEQTGSPVGSARRRHQTPFNSDVQPSISTRQASRMGGEA
ncbi:hypothetical protein COHA_002255 [Chlorella ohadii]|uniref:LysM domain-containing protein n=1 Tax=Chlorella ohadii TaxID=2649997 RepID=A0AAD5H4Z9_9CHLO|nr:hypothetical protein COHA_002255 [Chlorella ohadii]